MTTTSSIISLALVSFLCHLVILTAEIHKCFTANGYYSATSTYRTNLNVLLPNLTSDTDIDYGFYSAFYGKYPNRVHALGHCRGDVNPDSCRSCVDNAAKLLPNLCPNQKEAFSYDELCILRYSSRSMLGIYENPDFSFCMANPNNETDADVYNGGALDGLLASLSRNAAVTGDSYRKYAAGNMRTQAGTIYGLVQCTPDLSRPDCKNCLSKAVSEIPSCSGNKTGGRIIKLSCLLRYEHYAFYDS